MELRKGSKAKWKCSVRQISISGLLLSALLVSLVELSYASPADVTVTIDTGTAEVTNAFQVGFTLDGQSASYWRGSATAQRYSATNNYAMMRIFDHRLGNPCTYWDEDSKTGRWDWSEYDDLIDDLVALDVEPMICLGYYSNYGSYDALTSTPRGMTRNYAGTYLPDPSQYVEYAKDWVEHFNNTVTYYELINEPYKYYGWGGSNTRRLGHFKTFFNTVANGMRTVKPDLKLGNDASMMETNDHTEWWAKNIVDLDFLSWHSYFAGGTTSRDSYLINHAQNDEGGLQRGALYRMLKLRGELRLWRLFSHVLTKRGAGDKP